MAGLFAAQRVPAGAQLLEHVAVADAGGADLDARRAHRQVQAEVAHHGGHQGVGHELTRLLHGQRHDHHDRVAVDDVAVGVDREAAVGVAVMRQAEIGAVGHHGLLQHSMCVDPQPSLMFSPLGSALIAMTSAPAAR